MSRKEARKMAIQQIDHFELWEKHRGHADQEARQFLTEAYQRIVKYVAGKIAIGLPHYVEFNDLIAAGSLGLIQAIDNFDHQRGLKFNTYAIPRIRGAILDELRNQDWLPRTLRRKIKLVATTTNSLEINFGRQVSAIEIATQLKISLDEFDILQNDALFDQMLSIDGTGHGENGHGEPIDLKDILADHHAKDPLKILVEQEMLKLMKLKMLELPEIELQILILYSYEELSLRQIGEIFGFTESRACQIYTTATRRLKKKIERKPLPLKRQKRTQNPRSNTQHLKKITPITDIPHKLSNHEQLIELLNKPQNTAQLASELLQYFDPAKLTTIHKLLTLADMLQVNKNCPQFEETKQGVQAYFFI